MLKRIRFAFAAGLAAWRQYDAALAATRPSEDTGAGWNSQDYPHGFVDLYGGRIWPATRWEPTE